MEVDIGTKVWDIQSKWGTVTRIRNDGTFEVQFVGAYGKTLLYQPDGMLGVSRDKRLFFQDMTPFLELDPPPGAPGEEMIQLVIDVAAFIAERSANASA